MNRNAINPRGCLGFSYDGYRDQVVQQSQMDVQGQGLSASGSSRCQLINGNKDTNFNFLQIIGVDDEIRLSLLLQLTNRTGIADVLNYSRCIDEHTRFLYYSWICRTEEFHKKNARIQTITGGNNPQNNATHIITNISYGIDLVVVLQLPSENEILHKIDLLLMKISRALSEDKNGIFELNSDKDDSLKKVLNTKVYSNVPILTCSVKISDILHQINTMKRNSYRHHPVTYNLQSIASLYRTNMRISIKFSPLSARLRNNIEQYILQVRNKMKYVEACLNDNLPKLLCGCLEHQLKEAHSQCSEVKKKLKNEIQRFSTLVVAARHDRKKAVEEIDQVLIDNQAKAMENSIDKLVRYINALEAKGQLITNLRHETFEYLNVAETNLNKCDDLKTIEWMLFHNNPRNRVLCSSDTLNQKNESKLIELHRILIKEHEHNPTLRLTYLDFSYSSLSLQNIIILPSDNINHHKTHSMQQAPLVIDLPQASSVVPTSPPLTDEITNILLLGETGVGKSTFINAFANYLTFSSLEQARSSEPVVIIPVSFIMTTGDNFEERTIKFGEFDSSNNEDFNNVGQSVTQHCKSYVFDLKENGKKVRIIDTPGFGDTRGLDQDDRNMEHILQYINNLTHLDAICFLLKPNSSRLNMFFRTCLTQLFSFLAPSARKNIIFCFTNGRSTFYTPGDTAPLLKTMLKSLSINDISFERKNTFCFDNESFRYLVALQNEVSFTEEDKREYETSWSTSVKESNRLVDHIRMNLRTYDIGSGWQSIKHAQFEISHMIRPILEAMRNILRNQILCKNNLSNQFIEMNSKPVHCTATRCLSCKSDLEQVGIFWVIPIVPHEIQDDCRLCQCPLDQHVPIDYVLEYQCLYGASDRHQNATNGMLDVLCGTSAEFAHFLIHTGHSVKGDPFLSGLEEMIDEEKQICKSQNSSDFNLHLINKLTKLKELYESYKQKISERKSNQRSVDLPDIYRSIDGISKYPMVNKQIVAVKQSQHMMMEDYEYKVQTI